MMIPSAALHQRRSIRLQGYDYSQSGAYFITLCTRNSECLFGKIVGANHHSPAFDCNDSVVALNDAGKVANQCWLEIPDHFPSVALDAFIIMPNHVHGIVLITKNDRLPLRAKRANDDSPLRSGRSETIGSIVRGFKIGVTKWFKENHPDIQTVWQRNYYEHVIRNEDELKETRVYIANNPARAMDH
jgi:putative transposase